MSGKVRWIIFSKELSIYLPQILINHNFLTMKNLFLTGLLAMSLFLSQCSWFKKKDPAPTDPVAKLPPETQTGANTFGCLVNEKPFTPKGKRSTFSNNYTMDVDPGFNGGIIAIVAYRYDNNSDETITVSIDSTRKYGVNKYKLICKFTPSAVYGGEISYRNNKTNQEFDCIYNAQIIDSEVNLTRYDLQAKIFSGNFRAILVRGSDTLKITNGRFDKKLN